MSIFGRLWSRFRELVRSESGVGWDRLSSPAARGRPPGAAVPPPVDATTQRAGEDGADCQGDGEDSDDEAVVMAAAAAAMAVMISRSWSGPGVRCTVRNSASRSGFGRRARPGRAHPSNASDAASAGLILRRAPQSIWCIWST